MNQIEGFEFSGFPGFDAANLPLLTYTGRVEWLRFRFELVFLNPFRRLVALENADCYIWLCVMELSGAAIHALANMAYGSGPDRQKFTNFLNAYMPAFQRVDFELYDPRQRGNDVTTTAAEHFYKFFRSGLAHSFCIEWGGIQHREEVAAIGPEYLFQATQGFGGEHSLGVVPREFVRDFETACRNVFEAFAAAGENTILRLAFDRNFERVFLAKARRPLP